MFRVRNTPPFSGEVEIGKEVQQQFPQVELERHRRLRLLEIELFHELLELTSVRIIVPAHASVGSLAQSAWSPSGSEVEKFPSPALAFREAVVIKGAGSTKRDTLLSFNF